MISKTALVTELAGLAEPLIQEYVRRWRQRDAVERRPIRRSASSDPLDPYVEVSTRANQRLQAVAADRRELQLKIEDATRREKDHRAYARSRIRRAPSAEAAGSDPATVAELIEADHLRYEISAWTVELAEADELVSVVQRFQAALETTRRRMRSELDTLRRRDRAAEHTLGLSHDMTEAAEIGRLIREELTAAINDRSAQASGALFAVQNRPAVARLLGAGDVASDEARDEIRRLYEAR